MRSPLKILLVYPNIWSDVFPLSILILSAVLKEQGYQTRVFSAVHRRRVNTPPGTVLEEGVSDEVFGDFQQTISEFQPDVVALSVVEDAFPLATRLLDALPDYPGTVIVGGVFATFAPARAIAHPRVDAVCIGEGENVLVALCRCIEQERTITQIPGLWVRDREGNLHKNPSGAAVDLDALPAPDYSILDRHRFQGPVPLIAHRGCPYPCSFCNSPAQSRLIREDRQTAFFRKQGMAALRRDLEILTSVYADRLNETGLYFCSDTLLAWSNREFDAFIELYSDFRIPFICHTTPETISEDRMNKLMEVGLRLMNIGVQHGNEIFRRDVLKRRMPNRELKRRFDIATGSGAFISADFIMGFPGETPALAWDTIHFSRDIRASAKNCSLFVPYHGTELRQAAEQAGFIAPGELAVWSPEQSQLTMPAFPKAEISRLLMAFRARPFRQGLIAAG